MFITVQDLKDKGAKCSQISLIEKVFPGGANVNANTLRVAHTESWDRFFLGNFLSGNLQGHFETQWLTITAETMRVLEVLHEWDGEDKEWIWSVSETNAHKVEPALKDWAAATNRLILDYMEVEDEMGDSGNYLLACFV